MRGLNTVTTNVILATITAYCHCTHCCSKATGLNAAGKSPIQGLSIAAPRSIPLGSHIHIGTRRYIADDRLAKRYTNRFDIYFAQHTEALRFGIRTNTVTIITK